MGGWGRVPFSRNSMSPTPRRKWYSTTGRRAHQMVLDPIPQSLPVHFFGSRPQPPTSHQSPIHTSILTSPATEPHTDNTVAASSTDQAKGPYINCNTAPYFYNRALHLLQRSLPHTLVPTPLTPHTCVPPQQHRLTLLSLHRRCLSLLSLRRHCLTFASLRSSPASLFCPYTFVASHFPVYTSVTLHVGPSTEPNTCIHIKV